MIREINRILNEETEQSIGCVVMRRGVERESGKYLGNRLAGWRRSLPALKLLPPLATNSGASRPTALGRNSPVAVGQAW